MVVTAALVVAAATWYVLLTCRDCALRESTLPLWSCTDVRRSTDFCDLSPCATDEGYRWNAVKLCVVAFVATKWTSQASCMRGITQLPSTDVVHCVHWDLIDEHDYTCT